VPGEHFKNFWGTDVAVSYGWNSTTFGLGICDAFEAWPPPPSAPDWHYKEYWARVKETQIRNYAGTIMVGEIYGTVYHPSGVGYEYMAAQFGSYGASTWEYPLYLASYHSGGANVLWCDGHVTFETTKSSASPRTFDRTIDHQK
jgi:prepilin-type processing-associated H-X9-DG protein